MVLGNWILFLTQLRSSVSFLNYDLLRVKIVYDSSCRCGAALENLKHFFLDCPTYKPKINLELEFSTGLQSTCFNLDIKYLTYDNVKNLTCEQICTIFKCVFDYITCSKKSLSYNLNNWVNLIWVHLKFILPSIFFVNIDNIMGLL
jgi:hypothetical protein